MDASATTQPAAIRVEGLAKRYRAVVALDGLDLSVEQGAFYGLLGPNGAGKTTTVSVLATLARPDAGRVQVAGFDVVREQAEVRAAIGIVFQEPSLDRELTAREHLDLQGRLYHLDDRRRRTGEALERVGLASDADRPVRGFSGGMKRRLEIARGLLHRPRVLFLDEPTLGLDVNARAGIWEQLRELHADGGTTVFLTTHSMDEADALCERIGILDAGRLVTEGAPEALKSALGGDVVEIGFEQPDGCAAAESLAHVEGVLSVTREPEAARLRITVRDGPRRLAALLEAVRPHAVSEVALHRPDLEHVFLHHTGHPFEPGRLGGSG